MPRVGVFQIGLRTRTNTRSISGVLARSRKYLRLCARHHIILCRPVVIIRAEQRTNQVEDIAMRRMSLSSGLILGATLLWSVALSPAAFADDVMEQWQRHGGAHQ